MPAGCFFSEISYSQPVTRASSATAIPSIPGTTFSRYDKHLCAPTENLDSPLGFTEGSLSQYSEYYDPEPNGPYFSLPKDPTSDTSQLVRQRTTKELIGRYESLSSPTKTTPTPPTLPQQKRSRRPSTAANIFTPTAGKKEKGRSPIRQSFRNLLSVFKKGKNGKDQTTLLTTPSVEEEYTALSAPDSPLPTACLENTPKVLNIHSVSNVPACATPYSIRSGPLYHLSRPSLSTALPVWLGCTAVLHPSHILLTWHSTQGNPSTTVVPFTQCTDVRSLATADLQPTERDLLPKDTNSGELKIFELLFEGRARERFAATSVKDRAAWVSAIWDAILYANEQRSSMRSPSLFEDLPAKPGSTLDNSGLCLSQKVHTPAELSYDASKSASHILKPQERELPAIPVSPVSPAIKSPVRITLHDAPVPRPPVPSSGRFSPSKAMHLQTPPPSRFQSPSMLNLDKRSVVKQRLAEIERYTSTNIQSPVRPTKSTRRIEVKESLLVFPASRNDIPKLHIEDFLQKQSRKESEKVISEIGSSSTSQGLPPIRSFALPSPINIGAGPHSDIFSPASQYSTQPSEQIPTPTSEPASNNLLPIVTQSSFSLTLSRAQSRTQSGIAKLEQQPQKRIEDQIVSTQDGLRDLPQTLGTFITERSKSAVNHSKLEHGTTRALLGEIDGSVKRLENQGQQNAQDMTAIQGKMDAMLNLQQQATAKAIPMITSSSDDSSSLIKKLEEVKTELANELPNLAQKLDDLLAARGGSTIAMRNIPPSPRMHVESDTGSPSRQTSSSEDLVQIQSKLQEILAVCQAGRTESAENAQDLLLQELLTLVKENHTKTETQMEQQADSARYLNELNSWLEAFVNHGTSQIETIVAGVHQLCKELGPVPELCDSVPGESAQPAHARGNLLADIRQLLIDSKGREEGHVLLHTAVHELATAVQEEMERNAETRNGLSTDAIAGLIERQRQEQEHMLRSLAAELSNDIRGERLRFVEAMKEATTINVQIHVEQFKKELTREVLLMTQEVAKLHRERQGLEQQIADLFAFYAKRKQQGEGLAQPVPNGHLAPPTRASSSRPHSRPLPNPGQTHPVSSFAC